MHSSPAHGDCGVKAVLGFKGWSQGFQEQSPQCLLVFCGHVFHCCWKKFQVALFVVMMCGPKLEDS